MLRVGWKRREIINQCMVGGVLKSSSFPHPPAGPYAADISGEPLSGRGWVGKPSLGAVLCQEALTERAIAQSRSEKIRDPEDGSLQMGSERNLIQSVCVEC